MVVDIKIYCDGSCSYKTRVGGYGVYIVDHQGNEFFYKHGYTNTTISRMELMAFLEGIKKINKTIPCQVRIVSDSEYVILAFSKFRIRKWNDNYWTEVKNLDLWYGIIKEIELRPFMNLKPIHVRGHQKDLQNEDIYGNNVADLLADIRHQKDWMEDKPIKTKPQKLELFSSSIR